MTRLVIGQFIVGKANVPLLSTTSHEVGKQEHAPQSPTKTQTRVGEGPLLPPELLDEMVQDHGFEGISPRNETSRWHGQLGSDPESPQPPNPLGLRLAWLVSN